MNDPTRHPDDPAAHPSHTPTPAHADHHGQHDHHGRRDDVHNLPLEKIAAYLRRLAPRLIIEFVPKSDSQVRRLMLSRSDIFPHYTKDGFEQAFARHFTVESSAPIENSERWLYCMSSQPPDE